MNQMVRIAICILIGLLLAGTSIDLVQADSFQEPCAPGDSNGARPYWSYYQYPSMAVCEVSTVAKPQTYWSYYQYPPRYNLFIAEGR
jgi:hypothetical protein